MQPDGKGRHTQEERHRGERSNHSSRQEQKEKVREDSACPNVHTLPCDNMSKQPSRVTVRSRELHMCTSADLRAYEVRTAAQR